MLNLVSEVYACIQCSNTQGHQGCVRDDDDDDKWWQKAKTELDPAGDQLHFDHRQNVVSQRHWKLIMTVNEFFLFGVFILLH